MAKETGSVNALKQTVTDRYVPVYVLAAFAGMSDRRAVAVFLEHREDWGLEIREVRIDGHNPVFCVRKKQRLLIDDIMRSWKVRKG